MNILASFTVLTAPLAAGAASGPPTAMEQPAYREPARPWTSVEQAERERECRDKIELAREKLGHPELEKAPSSPDRSFLMHAVDTRIDGCGVIVPVADPTDLREAPPPGAPRFMPAAPAK